MKRLAALAGGAWLAACVVKTPPVGPVTRDLPAEPADWDAPLGFPVRVIHGVPFVEARVDDGAPLWFAVDTGSPMSVFDATLAARLHKRDAHVDMTVNGTTAGSFDAEMYRVDAVRVGDASLDNVLAIVTDMSQIGERVGVAFGGILGLSAFEGYVLTIDYPNRLGRLDHRALPPPDGASVLPYVLDSLHPSIVMDIGGAPTLVEIDSGSGYFMGFARGLLPRVKLRGPLVVIGEAIGMTGMAQVTAARLDATFAVGAYAIVDPIVFESADPSLEADNVARIGGPLLDKFAVSFDQRERRVRFTRPVRDPITALPVRTDGVQLVRHLSAWTVVGFVPGTAAPALGIQVGDELVEIDGQPAGALDADELSGPEGSARPRHVVLARGTQRIELDVPTVELVP